VLYSSKVIVALERLCHELEKLYYELGKLCHENHEHYRKLCHVNLYYNSNAPALIVQTNNR
jgi:hypothetical protein